MHDMRFLLINLMKILTAWIMLSAAVSCSKKDQPDTVSKAGIQNFSLFQGEETLSIDQSLHHISVRVPDSVRSGKSLAASFTLSAGARLSVNGLTQHSGITRNDFENDLHYTVTSSDGRMAQDWTVQAFNNTNSVSWGLGHFINSSVSNEKSYNWYIDQSTSGNFAPLNCGPASVTMAIKWADPDFTKTALDARLAYQASGGWWFTSDIDAYLTDNHIGH